MQPSKSVRVIRLYLPAGHSVHVQSLQGSSVTETSLSEDKGYTIHYIPDRRIFRVWNSRRQPGSICRVTTIPVENVTDWEVYGDEELSEQPEAQAPSA